LAALLLAVRNNVVRGNGDWLDLFLFATVLTDVFFGNVGLVQDLVFPLADRKGVGHENQSLRSDNLHDANPNNGLARPAGKDDHTGPAFARAVGVKDFYRMALVIAQSELTTGEHVGTKVESKFSAVVITGQVFHGKPDLDQRLLDVTARVLLNDQFPFRRPTVQKRLHQTVGRN